MMRLPKDQKPFFNRNIMVGGIILLAISTVVAYIITRDNSLLPWSAGLIAVIVPLLKV